MGFFEQLLYLIVFYYSDFCDRCVLTLIYKLRKYNMKKSKGPCWSGYEMIGMKDKGGKKVPNCVPVKKRKHGSSKEGEIVTSKSMDYYKGMI